MSTSASRPSDQQIQFPDRFEMNSSKEKFAFLILISVLVFNGGCGQEEASGPEPSTYSVRGTILQADGKPLSMGMVEFQPLGDTKANGLGTVKDGEFTLAMMLNGKKYSGVTAGQYRVIVIPRGTTVEQQGNPESIVLPEPVTIEAKSENALKLVLPEKK